MLREVVGTIGVLVPLKDLERNGEVPTSVIANLVLLHLSKEKATECGYLLSMTKLISIERGYENPCTSQHIIFNVVHRCRVFLPVTGEIFTGVVSRVNTTGVFLKSGPVNIIYLSNNLMPGYRYALGECPMFLREDSSKIGKDMVIRFLVYDVRWEEDGRREFKVLASIKGDGLGPVSLAGWDGLELCVC